MSDSERFTNMALHWRDSLSLFVGQGRRFAPDAVAAASLVNPDHIRRYLRGENTPSLTNYSAIASVVGADLVNAFHAPLGIGHARTLTCGSPTPEHTLTALLKEGAELAEDLQDGRLDHVEKKQRAEAFRALASKLNDEASALDPPPLILASRARS